MTQWFDETQYFQRAIEADVRRIARLTHTPPTFIVNEYKEALMTQPSNHIHESMLDLNANPNRIIPSEFLTFISPQTPVSRGEMAFRALKVQPGDRIRLTHLKPGQINPSRLPVKDASTLEGVVTKVKQKKGASKVQIAGFGVAGNAVFWPVADYRVEVLHRSYRWTDDDRLFAELAGHSPSVWEGMSETRRDQIRRNYATRADRVKKILGGDVSRAAFGVE